MKSLLAAAALIAAFAGGAFAAEPHTLTIKPLRERLRTIDVVINGQSGEFLLDTGGGVTTISPEFAAKIGCKPWGRITGFRMFGDRIDMQRCDDVTVQASGVAFKPVTLAVLDSTPYLKPGEKAPDGALALDVFEDQVITLEVAANRLIIETPDSLAERIKGATEVPFQIDERVFGEDVYVGVDTPDGRLWFTLDSGAGGVMLVARDAAHYFGLDPNKEGKDGPQTLRFDLAPGIPVNGPALVADMILDGNLGMPFISRYALTMDLKNKRMWVKPA